MMSRLGYNYFASWRLFCSKMLEISILVLPQKNSQIPVRNLPRRVDFYFSRRTWDTKGALIQTRPIAIMEGRLPSSLIFQSLCFFSFRLVKTTVN